MDQKELDRLRRLAGNEVAPEQPEDRSRKNMYEIRQTLNEASKPDYADIDDDGDKDEPMKKAAKDKEKTEESVEEELEESADPYEDVSGLQGEAKQMREWANSVYKQYEDRGHYQEQPEGETVDLSLRRYLNAEPQKVQIEEDIDEEAMLREYNEYKGSKK